MVIPAGIVAATNTKRKQKPKNDVGGVLLFCKKNNIANQGNNDAVVKYK
jgi:hypothetical protein